MKKILTYFLVAIFGILCAQTVCGQTSGGLQWVSVETPKESMWVLAEDSSNSTEKIDVVTRDGQVVITTNRPTSVKVFTILGQPVATRTIQTGATRLSLPIRGIYILKAGETTRRINI